MNMQTAIVTEKKFLTPEAVELTLKMEAPYSYRPGQYLTVELEIQEKTIQRCYSLASTPPKAGAKVKEIKLAIKKVAQGAVSPFIVDQVGVGKKMQLSNARGTFIANKTKKEQVFFAGGSGISPNFSLLQEGLQQQKKLTLFYFNRHKKSVMYDKPLRELAARHRNFNCHFFFGTIADFETMATLVKKHRLSQAAEYFVCGPEGMMDSVKAALEFHGISEEAIKIEYFQLENRSGVTILQNETAFSLVAKQNKKQKKLSMAAQESVLSALIAADFSPPYSCRSGVCGTCMVKKQSGTFFSLESDALTEEEKKEGYCLSCITYPLSKKSAISF